MKRLSLIVLSLFVFTSCASQKKAEEREIDERAKQSSVSSSAALGGTIHEAIANSKTLTEEQKKELTKILEANKKRADELTEQSFKYRGVLIQELFSENMSKRKVKIIKADIKRVEQERLRNTFQAIEQISKIVAKQPDNEKFSEHLINFDRRSFR